MNNFLVSIPIIYLAIYWIGAFFIVYHLIKYGTTSWPRKIVGVFLAGSIILTILNFMLFIQIDWMSIFGSVKSQTNIVQQVTGTNTK